MRFVVSAVVMLVLLVGAGCAPKTKADLAAEALQRGLDAHFAGRPDDAATAYHEVLDNDPRNKFAFYNLGLLEQTGRRDRAAENYYRLALNVDPVYVPALFNLAIVRTTAGDAGEAADLYRRVIAAQPRHAEAHLNLGFLLRSTGQEQEASAALRRAVELDPRLASRLGPVAAPSPTP